MKRRALGAASAAGAAVACTLLLGAVSCSRTDSLVLLDLRRSGPLGAPVQRVRLSASGWPTRTVTGDIGAEGFRVGYYGPASGGAVSVTAEALATIGDKIDCVLGSGSATVPKLAAGATSDPVTLFVRPEPANGCVPDAGTPDGGGDDGGGQDVGGDDGGGDDGGDGNAADGPDGGADAPADAGAEVGPDSAADAMDGAGDDGNTADAAPD